MITAALVLLMGLVYLLQFLHPGGVDGVAAGTLITGTCHPATRR